MFFTVEEAQAAQTKEEKLQMTQYSLQIDINTDKLIHHRELYSSPVLNNFFLKENQTKTNIPPKQKQKQNHKRKSKTAGEEKNKKSK